MLSSILVVRIRGDIMSKIIIASDSFKGSLSAFEACSAIRDGILMKYPHAHVELVPMADGGEGSASIIAEAVDAGEVRVRCFSANLDSMDASYYIKNDLAIIEIASCCSLTMSKSNNYNPKTITTQGFGQMIKDAIKRGCTKLILCLGGSSTSDGGLGMLSELGVRFLDKNKNELPCVLSEMVNLDSVDIAPAMKLIEGIDVVVATDVRNPYIGIDGAIRTFGPQKGIEENDIDEMECYLTYMSDAFDKSLNLNLKHISSSGAAGGLGGALYLLGAQLVPGIELVIEYTNLKDKCEGADLIISGEGSIDAQTINGKVISGIARLAGSIQVPMIAFGGIVSSDADNLYDIGVDALYEISKEDQTQMERLKYARENLCSCTFEVIDRHIG